MIVISGPLRPDDHSSESDSESSSMMQLPGRFAQRQFARLIASSLFLVLPSAAFAQRELKDIPVPDPVEELRTFEVAEGFEVNLFAADPLLHKPIQINFDPQGRLWIAASEVYPQIAPGQKANDKIVVLEDADGDGVADKTTVFADGLLIPTGVEPGDGGAYVANSTELLHLTDTDGDGKADKSRIVLSGFGTEDTHHIIHTFRWGPEGLFYFNQSIYIHSHVETPYGVRRLNAGGIWQFRPETLQLDVLARGWVNTWGHAFDRWGQSFVTDGAGGEGINYLVPGAAYPTAFGVARVLHGLNPGSPKYCGLEMVDGRHLPDDWQGNLITHDFRGHRVCRFVLQEDGAGFAARQQPDLIQTKHVAFRPIDVKQGPDGAIYIADWYNPIIQHGEVDFRDPRRDHVHGRIWRVTAKGRPLVKRPELVKATTGQLLESLKSPETYTRQHAKRVLKERGRDEVLPALTKWAAALDPNDPEFEHLRLEALWMYQSIDVVQPELLAAVLESPDHRARAAAMRVVPHWQNRLPNVRPWLERGVADVHQRVRMEAVRALATRSEPDTAEVALRVVDHPMDQFLEYALWQTVREQKSVWLPRLLGGQFQDGGNPARILYAIRAAEASEAVPVLLQMWQAGKTASVQEPEVLDIAASLGGPAELRTVFDLALKSETAPDRAASLLRTLAEARRRRNVQPAGDLSGLSALLKTKNADLQSAAATTIGVWGLKSLLAPLKELARDATAGEPVRRAAIRGLAGLNDAAVVAALVDLVNPDQPEGVQAEAVMSLAGQAPAQAAELAIQWLARSRSAEEQARVVTAFLQQKGAVEQLVSKLNGQKLPEDAAKIALRTVTGGGKPQPELVEALNKAAGLTGSPKVLSAEEMAALVAEVKEKGDPARGEALFRRTELACLKCHAIGGAGGKVGPDLVSIGASAQADYLVDSMLQPNKQVKEGYNTIVVTTDEGKVFSGVKVRQSDTDLILRDAEDKEVSVPLNSIDEQANGTSLMPAGLIDRLTRAELVDLVRFLSELGKVGPYAVGNARVARRWEVLQPTPEAFTRLYRTSDTQLVSDDMGLAWNAAYTTVSGGLPIGEQPAFDMQQRLAEGARSISFARCRLLTSTAGKTRLVLNGAEGLQIWLNGKPLTPDATLTVDLPAGESVLTFCVERGLRSKPLRVELQDVAGSSAQVQFAAGK